MSDKDHKDNSRDAVDIDKVKELVELMKSNDLVELELANGQNRIMLKRPQPAPPAPHAVAHIPLAAPLHIPPAGLQGGPGSVMPSVSSEGMAEQNLVEIKSPMVGTFYPIPTPDAEPYVSTGSRVEPDTVVCIIEAMKVMNEIKSEIGGTITQVLCQAGQALEYGQPLFKVKPD